MNEFSKELAKIYEDYGQIHEEYCELNAEDGCDDGCTCAVKSMVKKTVEYIVEFISHDMKCDNEEQRKAVVKTYMNKVFF